MKTVQVKVLIKGQGGSPLSGVLVSAKLALEEVSQAGYVLPDKFEAKTDSDGIALFNLFPNQEGYTGSMYEFKIHNPVTMRATRVMATVPNQDCWLHDIANLPAYDGKPDGQLSIDKVNAISLQIGALRDNAASSATSAGNSATAAASSADSAASSMAVAIQKEAAAAGSAASAASSATIATQKAGDAAASANAAAGSATTATQKASDAATSASNAYQNANGAAASAATATQKASDAATSATNAAGSATSAAGSATSAAGSATTATQKASDAATSATAAAGSASSAASNATTATTKAGEAATSATSAANSATAASNSATNAAGSATTATQKAADSAASATSAASSAGTATQKATDAANSATGAASSANAAANSATTAAQKAADSAASAANASGSASAAATSATTATQKASDAATSATAAANSAAQASANVLNTLLNGFSTASGIAVTSADTMLSAIGKLQAQVAVRATLASPQFTGTVSSVGGESFRAIGDTAFLSFFNTANSTRTGYVQGLAGTSLTMMAEGAAYLALGTGGTQTLRIMQSGNVLINAADNGVDKLQIGGSLSVSGPVKADAITTNDYTRIVRPGGGFNRLSGDGAFSTGAIGIILPVFYNYGMMMLRVRIYDYSSNTAHYFDIAGYAYAADSTWVNCSANYRGNTTKRFNVRFGNVGGKLAIWIGETNDSWGYAQVEVLDVLVGHAGASAAMTSGWSVTFGNTSFGNVTTVAATVNDAYTLQGFNASIAAVGNTVPVRDVNGHLYASHLFASFLCTAQPVETQPVAHVFTGNGSDPYLRKSPIGDFTSKLSGTAPISVTGTARGLTRSDSPADTYNVQSWWDGTYWNLKGYNGTTYHAGVRVAKADQADNATNATNAVTAGSATDATNARIIRVFDGSRNAATINPNSAPYSVRYDFVASNTTGMGGNYAGVMTFTPYDGSTPSTGDASYQLAFGSTAANGGGVPQLSIRKGIDSTWNSWIAILTAADIPSYAPSLTGAGASGTWSITSASANALNGPAHTNGVDGWFRSSGQAGWYNESYSVGIYATEGGNVRTYNGASFISGGNLSAVGTVTGANLTGAIQALNLDAPKTPGLYHYDQAFTGTRPAVSANFRTIEIGNSGRYTQVAFPFDKNDMYFRRQQDSAFGPWARVTTSLQTPITNKKWRYHPDDGTNLNDASSEHGFDYNTGNSGVVGPFLSFGALNIADSEIRNTYQCQLIASYSSSNFLKFRTQNGDAGGAWNPWRNIWHDGNLTRVSQLSNDVKYRSSAAVYVAYSALDGATEPGDYMVDYGGYGAGMTVFNVGGSAGTVQQLFHYTGAMMFRNKTDNATWTPWKTVWHSGNSTTSGAANSALVLDGTSTATMRCITLNQTDGSGAGIALYPAFSNNIPTYGLAFADTGSYGKHGAVNADWATYFTMNSMPGRGWIFRNVDTGVNTASISNTGAANFQQVTASNAGETFRSYGDNCYITWYGSNGVRQGYIQAVPGSALTIAAEAGNDFLVMLNGVGRFRINTYGTATLGPATDESLRIARNGGYISFYNEANTARTGYLQYNAGGDVIMMGEANANGLVLGTNGQTRLYISKSGDAAFNQSVTSPLFTQTSDERKKKNWKPAPAGLVERLAGIKHAGTYEWQAGNGKRHYGVGAQSLADVMPEAVYGSEDSGYTVGYGSAALVAAVELAKELVDMRKELEEIRAELATIKGAA